MNWKRTPHVSSLGRFSWPDTKKIGTFAAVIIIPLAGLEATYLATAPNNSSSAMGGIGNYTLIIQSDYTDVSTDVQYIYDEETLDISYTWDDVEIPEGFEVSEIYLIWEYDETDETTDPSGPVQQASCLANPGENVPDTTTGTFIHDDYSDSLLLEEDGGATFLGFGMTGQEFWAGSGWLFQTSGVLIGDDLGNNTMAWNLSGISEKAIHDNMTTTGDHPGVYSMSIRVDAETGGNSGCPHSDEGEEIEYRVRVTMMKVEIIPMD